MADLIMQKKRKPLDIGSAIGWLVFGLVIAGAPLLNALQGILGIRFPSYILPALVAGAVLLSVVVSIVRAVAGARPARDPGDMRYPTALPPSDALPGAARGERRPMAPMPPFAGEGSYRPVWMPPDIRTGTPAPTSPPVSARPPTGTPGFEPVVSAPVLLLGVLGVLALIGLGIVLIAGF